MGEMSWWGLAQLMVRPMDPEPTLRGVIRSAGTEVEPENSTNYAVVGDRPLPVFTGVGLTRRPSRSDPEAERRLAVWRDGDRPRVEEADGTPFLISDGDRTWTFPPDGGLPVVGTGLKVVIRGSGTHLLQRRTVPYLIALGEPVAEIAPARVQGRDAWWVTFDAVEDRQGKREVMVDAETGLVLRQRDVVWGGVDEWVELTVGEPLDPNLFTYDGPTRVEQDVRAAARAEERAEDERRLAWFGQRVASADLRAEMFLEVSVSYVHELDEATGAFMASLDIGGSGMGTLARRPRSKVAWKLRWATVDHRWSTTRWDWALTLHGHTLTDAGLVSIQAQLGDAP